jgi:maltose-binding protein MalE
MMQQFIPFVHRQSLAWPFITLLVVVALVLTACGQAPAGTSPTAAPAEATSAPAAAPTEPAAEALGSGSTKIVIWHGWQGAYADAIKAVFADYAKTNNVTIELLQVPDIPNKVQVAVPSGQGPDIIAWVNDKIGSNTLAQIIQPLDQYGVDEAYIRSTFTPVAADGVLYGGKPYAIPESLEALTFIYNKALISEADLPKTTDDLIAKAKTYNGTDKYLFVYDARANAYFSAPWWQGSGVTLVTPDGATGISSEAGLKAAELIKSFTEIMPAQIDYSVADALFKESKAAIIMNGPWAIADYLAAGMDVGLATIPVVSNSGQPAAPLVGVKVLMLANKAKQPEAAVALMRYFGSSEVQARLAKANKQVPANTAAQEEVKADPIVAGFINQAALGKAMPNSEFIDALWDPLAKTVEAIWTGTQSPADAIAGGAQLFNDKAALLK